jgi:tetratricopeptide (TPR) repeat protein
MDSALQTGVRRAGEGAAFVGVGSEVEARTPLNATAARIAVQRAAEVAFPDESNGAARRSFLHQLGAHLVGRGRALASAKAFPVAIDLFRDAAALVPERPETWHNLAEASFHAGDFAAGRTAYKRAATIDPGIGSAWLGWASCAYQLGRFREAVRILDRALLVHPENIRIHFAHAQVLLLLGEFRRGWQEYEQRFESGTHASENGNYVHSLAEIAPVWKGEPLAGKTILLHTEQGFGDAIQFARFVGWLKRERGAARVHVNLQAPLANLFRYVDGIDLITRQELDPCPPFEYHLAAMSIPSVIGLTNETTPGDVPYIHLPAEPIEAHRLPQDALNVGLCWRGRPEHGNDRQRSIPIEALEPLRDVQGARFYSLQLGTSPEWMIPLRDAGTDWLGDAALIANLDLVICVDTAVGHLAGALGKAVWLLTAFAPDWRWQLKRRDSPWYPRHTLYRQAKSREWVEVIDRVVCDLKVGVRSLS